MWQDYRLEIAGVRKSFEAWGIDQCVVKRGLWGEDEMTFTAAGAAGLAPLLSYMQRVALVDAGGVCRFIGPAMEPTPIITPTREGWAYRVVSPQLYLQGAPYQQIWRFRETTDGEDPGVIIPTADTGNVPVSLVILFRDDTATNGGKINLREQLDDALAKALTKATADGIPLAYSLDNVPDSVQPPEDEARDQSCADVMERALRWAPYVMPYWDMESNPATLRFASAPAIDEAGALIPGGRVNGQATWRSWGIPVDATINFGPRPMDDRLARAVKINYLIINSAVDNDKTYVWRSVETDESVVENGSLRDVVMTVPLRGRVYNGTEWEEAEPRPANGAARAIHQAFARMWWELNFSIQREDVIWYWSPGEGFSVTGAGTGGAAGANTMARRITRDLKTGTTTVETGAPSFLGLADITDLMLANRIRNVPKHAGEATYGYTPPDPGDTSDQKMITVTMREDGVLADFEFMGRRK